MNLQLDLLSIDPKIMQFIFSILASWLEPSSRPGDELTFAIHTSYGVSWMLVET